MRKLHKALLAGAGALLIGGAALAASERAHVLDVVMPDGAVAHIQYAGDAAPRLVLRNMPVAAVALTAGEPFFLIQGSPLDAGPRVPIVRAEPFRAFDMPFFAPSGPSAFSRVDALMAAMDAQMDAMMRQAAQLQAQIVTDPHAMRMVSDGGTSPGGAPAGVVQYSYVSTTSSNGCTTSVQWHSDGSGAEPKVIKTSSGACDGAKASGASRVNGAAPSAPEADPAVPGANRT